MQKHVKNYLCAMGFDESDFIPCEVCGVKAVDIHHIEERSKFGKKTKHLQDQPENLIALCRKCHEDAHNGLISKSYLKAKTDIRISWYSLYGKF